MSQDPYTYPCSGCGREITTSSEMLGKTEPCPYCETQNVVGPPESKEPDPHDLHRSAKGAAVCAVLSLLWAPFLFLSPFLLVLPILLGLTALALAYHAGRNMPRDSELAAPVRMLTAIGVRVAIVSLALLLVVAVVLWATGYQPWPDPPEPIEGPEGPPERSRPLEESEPAEQSRNQIVPDGSHSCLSASSAAHRRP